jgi:EmrB/QacA subfamily drug resistance transporter
MVDAYALVFAGLLFTAGTLGDRFGRKGALQGGLVLFVTAGVLAAFAETAGQVIAARGVMGVAAAFVMPSTLSILTSIFPPEERGRAISLWAGIAAGAAALGPVITGFLLEHFWWGSVFLVNVPVIIVALVAGKLLVPTSRDPEQPPLDVPGALLSIVGLGALVYGIIEGPLHGWTSRDSLAIFGVALVALGLFVVRERTARHPMLDLRLFRDRRFSVASGGMTLIFFAMFGTFFLVSQYFQLVLGYSALESGLFQLPMAFVMMGLSPQVPKLVDRFTVARVVPVGLLSVAIGLLLFSQVGTDTTIWWVYGPILCLAAGMALTMTPLTTLIMSAVPLGKAGVGSAMNDTTRELGGALGVAILGSVVTSNYASSLAPALEDLPAADQAIANSGLVGAFNVGERLGADGLAVIEAAKQAFVDGLSVAAVVGAVAVAVAAAASWRLLPRPAPPAQADGAPAAPVRSAADDPASSLDDDGVPAYVD